MKYLRMFLLFIAFMGDVNAAPGFQGSWRYMLDPSAAGGSMQITDCNDNTCMVAFTTSHGAHICGMEGTTFAITGDTMVADIHDEYHSDDCHIVLRKIYDDVIDVQSDGACNFMLCGMQGIFTGRWENDQRPRTYNPSFDCDKKISTTEMAICRDYKLSALDREISLLYKSVPQQKGQQRKWLKTRNKCGADVACLGRMYEERIHDLGVAITGREFSLYDYAQLLDDGFFHPNNAIFVENYIREHIGDSQYDMFIACTSRFSDSDVTDDHIFASYGCPGLFTLQESAIYIDADQIWIAYIEYDDDNHRFVVLYGPKNKNASDVPSVISKWIDDLQTRIKSSDLRVVFKKAF